MNDEIIDIAARHHIKLRTNENGRVTEVPLIDGRPFPGIRKIALYADKDRPAIAVIEVNAEIDFQGDVVIVQLDGPDEPPTPLALEAHPQEFGPRYEDENTDPPEAA